MSTFGVMLNKGNTERRLEGILACVPTVFTESQELDLEGIRENIEFTMESGIHGIITLCSVGEFFAVSSEEYDKIVDIAMDATASRRTACIVGTHYQNTRECIRRTKYAEDAGADAVMIAPPYYVKHPSEDWVYEHYRLINDVLEEAQILVYNNEAFTKFNMTPAFWDRLVKLDHVKAVKESSYDIGHLSELIRRHGERINVLGGSEAQLLPVMFLGGKGTVSLFGCPMPKLPLELYEACKDKDWKKGLKFHLHLTNFASTVRSADISGEVNVISIFKGLCEVCGRKAGPPRRPNIPLNQKWRDWIEGWVNEARKMIE